MPGPQAGTCLVCSSPHRDAVDAALMLRPGHTAVARQFALSEDAMYRHRRHHLPTVLPGAQDAPEAIIVSDDLLEEMRMLYKRTLASLSRSERRGDERMVLAAIREARAGLEFLGRVSGAVDQRDWWTGTGTGTGAAQIGGGRVTGEDLIRAMLEARDRIQSEAAEQELALRQQE